MASSLCKLTHQDSDWMGKELPEQALHTFNAIKSAICAHPILKFPTRLGKFHLFVDAALGDAENEGGLGAVLMQEDANFKKHPVAYASRRLLAQEANYTAFLLEMQAAVYGMDIFDNNLRGWVFCLIQTTNPLPNFWPFIPKL